MPCMQDCCMANGCADWHLLLAYPALPPACVAALRLPAAIAMAVPMAVAGLPFHGDLGLARADMP